MELCEIVGLIWFSLSRGFSRGFVILVCWFNFCLLGVKFVALSFLGV